jgi:photosystem II PsbZ protein
MSAPGAFSARVRIRLLPDLASRDPTMQILNTLTVLALVVLSFALIVAVPVLYASSEDSGRSNRLVLLGGLAWVALVLLNWGMSYFVV